MDQSEVTALMAAADASPHNVDAQIAAAYVNDRYGSEEDAIRYYDAAWALGVPEVERKRFLVGYGSTLRNVGRLDDSIAIYRAAIADYPGYAPNHGFLALTLHEGGHHQEAIAEALTAVLEAGADSLDGYDRALTYYRDALSERSDPT